MSNKSNKIIVSPDKRKILIMERKKRNWTQKMVAEQLRISGVNINRAHLSKIENGKNNPSLLVLKSLSTLFEISLDDLI